MFGCLAEYEPTLLAQRELQGTKKAKNLALVVPSKQRLADDDKDDEDIDDEDMAMMVRRFKKFFKRKGRFQRGESSYKKEIWSVLNAGNLVTSKLSVRVFRDLKRMTERRRSMVTKRRPL